jgi:hypothetical protein
MMAWSSPSLKSNEGRFIDSQGSAGDFSADSLLWPAQPASAKNTHKKPIRYLTEKSTTDILLFALYLIWV